MRQASIVKISDELHIQGDRGKVVSGQNNNNNNGKVYDFKRLKEIGAVEIDSCPHVEVTEWAVQFHPLGHGVQFFVRLPARVPHGACVWCLTS